MRKKRRAENYYMVVPASLILSLIYSDVLHHKDSQMGLCMYGAYQFVCGDPLRTTVGQPIIFTTSYQAKLSISNKPCL